MPVMQSDTTLVHSCRHHLQYLQFSFQEKVLQLKNNTEQHVQPSHREMLFSPQLTPSWSLAVTLEAYPECWSQVNWMQLQCNGPSAQSSVYLCKRSYLFWDLLLLEAFQVDCRTGSMCRGLLMKVRKAASKLPVCDAFFLIATHVPA